MDKRKALSLAKKYVADIHLQFKVKEAFLFGSFARGNYHEDSDIDIALVLKGTFDAFDMRVKLMKSRWDIDVRIEPHPIAEKEFNSDDSLSFEVLKYGIPIKLK